MPCVCLTCSGEGRALSCLHVCGEGNPSCQEGWRKSFTACSKLWSETRPGADRESCRQFALETLGGVAWLWDLCHRCHLRAVSSWIFLPCSSCKAKNEFLGP